MFKYPDFFKVGISESGNHDNRNYEDDWGERYIGLETKDNNGVSNYEKQANQEIHISLVIALNLKSDQATYFPPCCHSTHHEMI